MVFLRAGSLRTQIWTQILMWIDLCQVNFLYFLLYSSISSWNPHIWGAILRFPCKSLGKSSDCMDFINPWIYQIYLRIFNFSNFQYSSYIYILNLVIWIFELNPEIYSLGLCVLLNLSLIIILRKSILGQKFNFSISNFNFNLIAHIYWFDCLWSSRDHTGQWRAIFQSNLIKLIVFLLPKSNFNFSELLFHYNMALNKSFIIYFSTYLNGIIFNSILSFNKLEFFVIFLSKFSSSWLLGLDRVVFLCFTFQPVLGVWLSHLSWFPPHLVGFWLGELVVDTAMEL